jgi:hypothetical protein
LYLKSVAFDNDAWRMKANEIGRGAGVKHGG